MEDPTLWSAVDVCSWLRGFGLSEHCAAILEHDVTGPMLVDLAQHNGLIGLGIDRQIHQARIRTRLHALTDTTSSRPAFGSVVADNHPPPDQLVWAIGGCSGTNSDFSAVVEVLDTRSGQWATRESLPIATSDCGGLGGLWGSLPSMPTCRRGFSAVCVGQNLYTVGGQEGNDPFNNGCDLDEPGTLRRTCVEVLDLRSHLWSGGTPLPTGREALAVAAAEDKIYAIGGHGYARTRMFFSAVEELSLRTGQWKGSLPMKQPRGHFGLAHVGKYLYALGGHSGKFNFDCTKPGTIEVSGSFTGDMLDTIDLQSHRRVSDVRSTMAASLRAKANSLSFTNESGVLLNDNEATTNINTPTLGSLTLGQDLAQRVLKLKYIGPRGAGGSLDSVEVFDTQTGQWSMGPSMPSARTYLSAAAVGQTVYAVGGVAGQRDSGREQVLDTVEILDLGTGRWIAGPPLPTPRFRLAVVSS